MEVFREILFLIVMAWSIPNLIFFLIKLIKNNPKIFPIIISVIISVVGLIFSITFLKSIGFFETIGKKEICPYCSTDMGCDYCDYRDRNLQEEDE